MFDEGNDFFLPDGARRLAAVPVGQPADPFRQEDPVVTQAVRHREGASVSFDATGFGDDAKRAGPNFLEGARDG